MNWTNILQKFFATIIIPLLGAATVYLIRFVNTKRKEIKQNTENALAKKYIDLLSETIINCVSATNQTYVQALKDKNAFTPEAQKEAFKRTYNAVLNILTDDALDYLNTIYDDLETYITETIEASVYYHKQ